MCVWIKLPPLISASPSANILEPLLLAELCKHTAQTMTEDKVPLLRSSQSGLLDCKCSYQRKHLPPATIT